MLCCLDMNNTDIISKQRCHHPCIEYFFLYPGKNLGLFAAKILANVYRFVTAFWQSVEEELDL